MIIATPKAIGCCDEAAHAQPAAAQRHHLVLLAVEDRHPLAQVVEEVVPRARLVDREQRDDGRADNQHAEDLYHVRQPLDRRGNEREQEQEADEVEDGVDRRLVGGLAEAVEVDDRRDDGDRDQEQDRERPPARPLRAGRGG